MTRRSIATGLLALPWWVCMVMAGLIHVVATIGLPTLYFTNPLFKVMAGAVTALAPLLSFLLIALGCALAVRRLMRTHDRTQLLARQTDIGSVRRLSWSDFECLVGEVFRQQGYRVVENEIKGADHGIDLRLARAGEMTLVQCKHWNSAAIGVPTVRELLGITVSEGAAHGILVCSGRFTRSAKVFATKNGIGLIDGDGLVALAGIPSRDPSNSVQALPVDVPDCPKCGASMIKRIARKGRQAGQSFLGCSNFPACRGTRPLS